MMRRLGHGYDGGSGCKKAAFCGAAKEGVMLEWPLSAEKLRKIDADWRVSPCLCVARVLPIIPHLI
jgi:hypothetical protein